MQLSWPDEAACAAFARQLAARPALRLATVELHGTLGAGKTTFVRHLLRALGVQGRIKSPTYAVMESYELPGLLISHFDFYRFSDAREWADAGLRDVFAAPGLKLVEWPQLAGGMLPPADLRLHIAIGNAPAVAPSVAPADATEDAPPEPREVRIEAGTPLGLELLR